MKPYQPREQSLYPQMFRNRTTTEVRDECTTADFQWGVGAAKKITVSARVAEMHKTTKQKRNPRQIFETEIRNKKDSSGKNLL